MRSNPSWLSIRNSLVSSSIAFNHPAGWDLESPAQRAHRGFIGWKGSNLRKAGILGIGE